jgi:hypothetical protein
MLASEVHPSDLFVAVAAHRTSASYSPHISKLHSILMQYFSNRNLLIISPEQYSSEESQVIFLGGGK